MRRRTPSALTAEELAAAEEEASDLAGEMAKGAMTDAEMSTVRGWLAPPPTPYAHLLRAHFILFWQNHVFSTDRVLGFATFGSCVSW
jgi:hypothetical protein